MRWLAVPIVLVLAGCAAHYTPASVAEPYGFLMGIWHGFVSPYAMLTNLISWLAALVGFDLLRFIEVLGRPNTGLWYYRGFVLGLLPYLGSA